MFYDQCIIIAYRTAYEIPFQSWRREKDNIVSSAAHNFRIQYVGYGKYITLIKREQYH